MNWILPMVLLAVYNIFLWGLPVRRWKRRKATQIGLWTMVPFLVAIIWLTGVESFWMFYVTYLIWRSIQTKDLPEESGFDWAALVSGVVGVGLFVYVYGAHYGWTIPGQ